MTSYLQTTSDLIRNGEYERAWQRHCGFLDLSIEEFMSIQHRLLEEQFAIARNSRLWQSLFPEFVKRGSVSDFRTLTPLTDYADYDAILADQPGDALARPVKSWARTSGRGGRPKWVPYTEEAYLQLGRTAVAIDLLSTARRRGDVNIRPNDVVVYNLPARPYLSGLTLQATGECFDFRFVPRLDETEELSFRERSARVFQQAMVDGMDVLGAMTIVLVKMGEEFQKGHMRRSSKFSWQMLHPRVLWRYARAVTCARKEGRSSILPKDLWQPKGIICGGTDTSLYREQIKSYWGVFPHETYGCTEAGIIATQAWNHLDMVFVPSTAFLEFIPESAWAAERLRGVTPTETVRLDQLEVGKRYEVVLTSFYGGPFLRYRLHDLIQVVSLRDEKLGIALPQFRFVGRSGDFIDLSGFAGLIDEKQMAEAVNAAGVEYEDWVVSKEVRDNGVALHLYVETRAPHLNGDGLPAAEHIRDRVHSYIKQLNVEYGNIETMLGYVPLRVSLLAPGTFNRYMKYQVEHGADLAHLKPARIQPTDEALNQLQSLSQGA